jgi:SAM-dependent MidA family methyltransferase
MADLVNRLQSLCANSGAEGFVSFRDFMAIALYDPQQGYYSGKKTVIGRSGDFVTAPYLSEAFSWSVLQTLLRYSETLIQERPDLKTLHWVEPAAGDGTLARQLADGWIRVLEEGACPRALADIAIHYHGIEPVAGRRAILHATINAHPVADKRYRWQWSTHTDTQSLPDDFAGVIVANEWFDALPCEVVQWDEQGIWQMGVAYSSVRGFYWQRRNVQSNPSLAKCAAMLPPWNQSQQALNDAFPSPYQHEINLAMGASLYELSRKMAMGFVLFFDYGDTEDRLYHPSQSSGTLKSIHQHKILEHPWSALGEADITAHINFSALLSSWEALGGDVVEFTTQARFLVNASLIPWMDRLPQEPFARAQALAGFHQLIDPAMMGVAIKVMVGKKG